MTELTIALAGNPNAGKTTIFNALTGLAQHTGNWPGKTVEKKGRQDQGRGNICQRCGSARNLQPHCIFPRRDHRA
jgi:ribosome-binding ATPase YchF (GTP1/OBG family)